MRILITGATGFLGRQTMREALSQGHSVLVVSRSQISSSLLEEGAEQIVLPGWPTELDVNASIGALNQQGGIDAIIHLAGDATYGNGSSYIDSNVKPTQLLCELITKGFPDAKLVYASSVGAQDYRKFQSPRMLTELDPPNPLSDYGKSKLEAETIVAENVKTFSNVRLGMVIGETMREQSHLKALLKIMRNPLAHNLLSRLRGTMPLIDVRDAARGLLHLCNPKIENGVYLLVDQNLSVCEISSIAFEKTSRPKLAFSMGRFSSILPARLAPTFAPVMNFSNHKLKASGWAPQEDLAESIRSILRVIQGQKNVAVVTGVASGLGRAFLEELDSSGIQIIGVDIDSREIERLRAAYPHQSFIASDVREAELFPQIINQAESKSQIIDSLFLVAGLGTKTRFVEQSEENIYLQLSVNVGARFSLANKFLKLFTAQGLPSRIVIISSSSALQPLPTFATYCATNAALMSFGRSLAMETNSSTCNVVTVVPGGMDTQFQDRAGVKRLKNERLLSPNKVARLSIKKSQKRSSVLIIGRNARLTNLLARFLPRFLADALWNRITNVAR